MDTPENSGLPIPSDIPDHWVVLRLFHPEGIVSHRLFCTWHEGRDGPHWKLNSGIRAYCEHPPFIDFQGVSGSLYRCHREFERMSDYGADVLDKIQQQAQLTQGIHIEVILFAEYQQTLSRIH